MYLFMRYKTAAKDEIVLLSKYTVDFDPRETTLTISAKELEEEVHLNTIETRNFNIAEIERIYFEDMMQQRDQLM